MTVTTLDPDTIFGGIDTHADTIHVAAIDAWGRELADGEFPTAPSGYRAALRPGQSRPESITIADSVRQPVGRLTAEQTGGSHPVQHSLEAGEAR